MPSITATRQELFRRNGSTKGYRYEVREDGEVKDTRESHRLYTHIHVQRWLPVGSEGKYGEASNWAARYTSSPRAVGSKIEYGYVADVIKIAEASTDEASTDDLVNHTFRVVFIDGGEVTWNVVAPSLSVAWARVGEQAGKYQYNGRDRAVRHVTFVS